MARQSVPMLAFNRGLVSPRAMARVDIDRTRLSAETMTNWLAGAQGHMFLRPGTKYFGNSKNDTGAEYLEFVASTDDVALIELTDETMRIWLGDDAHELELLSRPAVNTTVTLSDTGWDNVSTGGNVTAVAAVDLIPQMTAETTNGVRVTADSSGSGGFPWHAADNNNATRWRKDAGVPGWLNVDFGSGNAKAVGSYTVRAGPASDQLDNAPRTWRLIGSNFDTGTFATDTGKWILENERTNETGWAISEKRTYAISDTGTPGPWRHWRLYVTALNGDTEITVYEFELLSDTGSTTAEQAKFVNGTLTLNATSLGAMARASNTP